MSELRWDQDPDVKAAVELLLDRGLSVDDYRQAFNEAARAQLAKWEKGLLSE